MKTCERMINVRRFINVRKVFINEHRPSSFIIGIYNSVTNIYNEYNNLQTNMSIQRQLSKALYYVTLQPKIVIK